MKNIMKRMIVIVLAVVMMFSFSFGVSAAETKKITVTYKNKTVTLLSTTQTYKAQKKLMYTTLKKSWGNPVKKTTTKSGIKITTYVWKKGKSSVKLIDNTYHISYTISIGDKNMKLNGLYVGMKKAAALKLIKKNFKIMSDVTTSSKIVALSQIGCPVEISIKSGKVSKIYFFAS